MKQENLPLTLFLAGLILKGLGVAAWRLWQPNGLAELLVRFDPLADWLGETVTAIVFDQRRIAPTDAEIRSYEALLVLGFGLELLLLGLLARFILSRLRTKGS